MLEVSLNPKLSSTSIRLSSAVVNLLTFVFSRWSALIVLLNPLFTAKVVASGYASTFIISLSITIRSPTEKLDESFTLILIWDELILNVSCAVLSAS